MAPVSSAEAVDKEFARDVWCLFGLSVDNVNMAATKELLRARVRQPGNMVLATININWVVRALTDPAFANAVLNSDLVVLDGRPLLWLARLLGCPMTEVVPGSTLIYELWREESPGEPLSLFLLGGEEGAAEQALARVNSQPGGVRAVGALNPGFGTVAELSRDEIISHINRSAPDILLVALGANKGTRWIEHNRERLTAKVISHLGATVNFLAGTVRRAPVSVQRLGLEWCWRILQEPRLCARYAADGMVMLRVLAGRVLLWARYWAWRRHFGQLAADDRVELREEEGAITLSFGRNVRLAGDSPLRQNVSRAVRASKDIYLDFEQTEFVDGALLGLLLLLKKEQQQQGKALYFVKVSGRLANILDLFCLGDYRQPPRPQNPK